MESRVFHSGKITDQHGRDGHPDANRLAMRRPERAPKTLRSRPHFATASLESQHPPQWSLDDVPTLCTATRDAEGGP